MISLRQINREIVRAIPIPDEDRRPIKGFEICEEVYANIFNCAKKKSGKTSAIFKIMKKCCVKSTIIYVFCSTVYKDVNWIEIRKYFTKKGYDIKVFTSIYENGENQLLKLLSELNKQAKANEEKQEDDDEPEEEIDKCAQIIQQLTYEYNVSIGRIKPKPEEEEEDETKPRKSKFRAPEYMIIFDDLSGELKEPSLIELLKKNRHYKTKIIISSQYLNDLKPESRKQIDLMMIFKGFPEEKLLEIYKDTDSSIPFKTFCQLYKQATEQKHSFLYIDTRSDSFRCCFNKQFILDEN